MGPKTFYWQYLKSISNRNGKKWKGVIKIEKKMSTMWELTIDFKLITGSNWVATTLFTCPLDLHVEGVSSRHVVDGQCRHVCRLDGSREDAAIDSTFIY